VTEALKAMSMSESTPWGEALRCCACARVMARCSTSMVTTSKARASVV
jgi:hypothetical protein